MMSADTIALASIEQYRSSGFGTRAIHAGTVPDPITGAVVTPISLATTFIQTAPGQHAGYDYSRAGNPTRSAFEAQIASIENAKFALAFSSGCAATATVIYMLASGDHVIAVDDVYGGTNRFFQRVAAPVSNISVSFVDFLKEGAVEAAIKPTTRLMWIETPTNPTLKIVDIRAAAAIAKKHNLILVVDNTFATPYLQNPLDLGADIVVHSVTKYLGGHSDVLMGVVATNNSSYAEKLQFLQKSIGAVPAPFDCYMALRGVKTLHLRMREHSKNALAVATFLESHPAVERVLYPGLPSHPQHSIAKEQMRGFGGMVTFFLRGGLAESNIFLTNLKLFALAESLGAVESLAEHPAIMTHASVPPAQRAELGISDSLVRLSIGVEEIDDLIGDLSAALGQINVKA